ncbi:MAG: hypothetical protein IJE90_02005 [Clostridia bacterium]|nr:hypothetical protein [Clostridia bacterium]
MKRTTFLLVVLTICLSLIVNASALEVTKLNQTISSNEAKIIDALHRVIPIKSDIGLGDLNFEQLEIGEVLKAYEYADDHFIELRDIYPLFYNGELVALANQLSTGSFNISTSMVQAIKNTDTPYAAIIYDANSCWLYDGIEFTQMLECSQVVEWRGNLSTEKSVSTAKSSNIQLCNMQRFNSLGYTTDVKAKNNNRSINSYYSCPITYVTQHLSGQTSKICWAATIACIKNYIDGTNYTAVDVARAKFGDNYNQGATNIEVQDHMRNTYNLYYTYHDAVPSDVVIASNLEQDKPIVARFSVTRIGATTPSSYHMMPLYIIDLSNEYIKVMDPDMPLAQAATYVYKEGNMYMYVCDSTGNELTFCGALCRYW